jgi:hypothetical protein
MNGFSVLIKDVSIKMAFKKGKNVLVQNVEYVPFLEREMIDVKKGKVVLFKKVSEDFKTQENTRNETLWVIDSIVEHKSWTPKKEECGEGKFHACSYSFFCDEFRNNIGDKYIALEIDKKDLFEWKNHPSYPHKIAFRKGKVLYECNSNGVKL